MRDLSNFIELAGAFGWEQIQSKNPHMISFVKEDEQERLRLNLYHTTMTATVQGDLYGIKTHRNISLEEFEKIVSAIT